MELSQRSLQISESENALPSSLDLKEIKQKLLSGEKEQIVESAEKIKFFIKNEKSMTEMLKSDISEFLCDAILSVDDSTVEVLYQCLEFLISHENFFHFSHSCFAIESLIRSIYFSLKNFHGETTICQTLNLLILIVQGFKTFDVFPEKKTIGNILQVVPVLLKMPSITVYLKYQVGNLILNLLSLDILEWSQEFHKTVLECIFSWFKIIFDILYAAHSLKEKIIMVCCSVSHFYLRFLNFQCESQEKVNIIISYPLKHDLIQIISNFLINVAASYFNSLSISIIESNFNNLEIFFQSLIYLYNEKISSPKSWITHGLSEMEFFQFTTRIISFVQTNSCQELQKLCILLLSSMIFYLSIDVFKETEFWPKGQDYFYNEIQKGFLRLPLDASMWLDILNNPNSPESCKLSLLLYLYFYCMTAKSQDILENIYPSIIVYINDSNESLSSPLILKIVWFIFVMSQLSHDQNLYTKSDLQAYNKLVYTLEAQEDFSLVYTHHPGLIYWVFSSKISKTIQLKSVQLWFLNKSEDCKVIQDLIESSTDVRFAILDIMQYANGQILESAFLSLKYALIKAQNNDLAYSLWLLLSQVLAKYTTDCISAPNVDYLIELCSLKAPNCLEVTKIIRIASLLPEIFLKSHSIAVVPFLILIFRLLELSLMMNDYRVLSVFSHYNGFLEKIMEGISINTYESDMYIFKIIMLLWRNSKNIEKFRSPHKIILNKKIFIKILENSNSDVLSSGLDLLQEILLTNFCSTVFEINEVNADLLHVLFFQVENICAKSIPGICHKCWRCLKLFLMITYEEIKSVTIDLIVDPLLHELVNFHLPYLNECREMMDFLIIWLHLYNEKLNDDCFKRKLLGGLFLKTVHKIANIQTKLTENFDEDEQRLRKEILKIGFSLEN